MLMIICYVCDWKIYIKIWYLNKTMCILYLYYIFVYHPSAIVQQSIITYEVCCVSYMFKFRYIICKKPPRIILYLLFASEVVFHNASQKQWKLPYICIFLCTRVLSASWRWPWVIFGREKLLSCISNPG